MAEKHESDYRKMITDAESDFAPLFSRMDADKDLLILKSYTMLDKDSVEKPDVENITLNDASVFAQRVQSNLIRANMQPTVSGTKLPDEYTSNVEQFFKDINLAFDDILQPREISSFMGFNVQQMCQRGRDAARITLRGENGFLAPDSLLPMDARYLVYRYTTKGLKWFCYRTSRRREDVRDEYGSNACSEGDTMVDVRDFWNGTHEKVWVAEGQVRNDPHKYGEPPAVIQVAPVGMMYQDTDRLEHSGESIYVNNRGIYGEKNKICSLLATLTQLAIFVGMQFETDDPNQKQPKRPPYGKKFIIPVKPGQGFKPMPVVDIKNATRVLLSMVDASLQDGSFPRISYGTLQFPISAVGMAELKEAEDPVYFPRMQGLAMFYQRLYRMILKQYIDQKMNVKLGDIGFQKKYNWTELNKPFSVKFRFFTTSPKQNMVNYTVASAAGDLISRDTKRRDILELENPDEEESKIWAEKAPQMSPGIAKYKSARALADQGEEVQAQIMAAEMGLSLDEVMSGKLAEKEEPPELQEPKQIMPLFAGRAGGPGKAAAAEGEGEIPEETE